MPDNWLLGDRAAVAADRILDAAGVCFARKGVLATSIGDIASEAGCSRPTVYRYFDDREALRTAFVHREARRLGRRVAEAIPPDADPEDGLVEAIEAALAGVRSDPTLAAWFSPGDAGATARVADASPVIEAMVAPLVAGDDEATTHDRARWVVRVVVSLLALPGGDEGEERRLVRTFLAPVVLSARAARARTRT